MNELKNVIKSNYLPMNGVKAIVSPEIYHKMLSEANKPHANDELTIALPKIPKWVADRLYKLTEDIHMYGYIIPYADAGDYFDELISGLDKDDELYKFMYPNIIAPTVDNKLLGCENRNLAYIYFARRDLVEVEE